MLNCRITRWLCAASLLGRCLLAGSGCQTWQSSLAIPGLGSSQGEREILRQAKNDPFPSPIDVGMKVAK